jgi:Flp pilus assembly protein TadD
MAQAAELMPEFAEAHNGRGNAVIEMRRFEQAPDSFVRARRFRPECTEACNDLGNALRELRRFSEALQSYHGAISVRPDYARLTTEVRARDLSMLHDMDSPRWALLNRVM